MAERLLIGTRGSALALCQAHTVAEALRVAHPELEIDIRTIQTQGDKTQATNVPLSSFGEKGIFAHELEAALLSGTIDLAVHSMKDMPHTLPPGLTIAAIPEREDPRDCMIGHTLDTLPHGARVGTGSVRRRALLWSRRPDLNCLEIRGNIDTRLRKWRDGQYDAICLAAAGLNRLGLQDTITEYLDPAWFTPDPGQGALCLEARADNIRVREWTRPLNAPASIPVTLERDFLRAMGGGCQTPLGALATLDASRLTLTAMVAAPDGSVILRETAHSTTGGHTLGQELAQKLKQRGADDLLQRDQP